MYVSLRTNFMDINQAKTGKLMLLICSLIKKFCYLITLVDTLTGWVEPFLTSREIANVMDQIILDHIIPQLDMPQIIQMDKGPAFASRLKELMSEALNISWKLYMPYHPQSLGKVGGPTDWISFLPIVLTCLQITADTPIGLIPFELLYIRPLLLSHDFLAQTPPLAGYLPYLSLMRSLLHSHGVSNHPAPRSMEPTAPEPALLSPVDTVSSNRKLLRLSSPSG